ncbi:MAG TPA: HAD family hydrolase [Candidatus Limnocylindria bacterium]|nr:HAD family hydrolase [Candidatus Limnocylindria bacterium]
MGVRAAFFDVGGTLVEHWSPAAELTAVVRRHLVEAFGERDWYDALIAADIEPRDRPDRLRQETNRWYQAWFAGQGIECDIEIDRLRSTFAVPIDLVAAPAPGGPEAVRWCKAQGLTVVLVTNVLSRGDAEVLRDWRRVGLGDAIDAVVSSHDVGWRKPHRAMFERALKLAAVDPARAFMVGDDPDLDIWGAQSLGIRAVWRRVGDATLPPGVVPDATIATLLELPDAVQPWL